MLTEAVRALFGFEVKLEFHDIIDNLIRINIRNRAMKRVLIALGLMITSTAFSLTTNTSTQLAPLFDRIGDGGFKADTQDPLCQKYFNQGMVFFYGFDFLEAIRSFEASLKSDANCTRCRFGLALSLGSVTNAFTQGNEIARANQILTNAKSTDPVTQGLLDALRLRYKDIEQKKSEAAPTTHHCAKAEIDLPMQNKLAFSNALFELMQQYPQEQTIKALFAYSVLGTENWDLYDSLLHPKPYTSMMRSACKQVLAINPDHIGMIHYYIHATEWSKTPAVSLTYADKLESLAPLAEHLVHMPSHIYLRIGEYNKAVEQNLKAVQSYKDYTAVCRQQGFQPVVNFLNQHNYDFLFASALMAGREDVAQQTGDDIRTETPLEWLEKDKGFQRFYALKLYTIAHFGAWDQLKPLEPALVRFPYLKAMWEYTAALKALSLRKPGEFDKHFKAFMEASKNNNEDKKHKELFANNLSIAKEVLMANAERHNGHWEQAILHWHKANKMQGAAGDPPEWYFPTQLGLAYTFLDAKKWKQSVLAFKTTLEKYPDNGWALYGIAQAYMQLGQKDLANEYLAKFTEHWDVKATTLPITQGSDLFMPQ